MFFPTWKSNKETSEKLVMKKKHLKGKLHVYIAIKCISIVNNNKIIYMKIYVFDVVLCLAHSYPGHLDCPRANYLLFCPRQVWLRALLTDEGGLVTEFVMESRLGTPYAVAASRMESSPRSTLLRALLTSSCFQFLNFGICMERN